MKKPASKLIGIALALVMCLGMVAACGGGDEPAATPPPAPTPEPVVVTEAPPPPEPSVLEKLLAEYGLDENRRFIETRNMTALIWVRDSDISDPLDNAWTRYIQEGMLRDHNVAVEFISVGRWSEGDDQMLLLADGTAPDVCFTFNYGNIDTFAKQGAITNLTPYLHESNDLFPNMWEFLGWNLIYQNQERDTGNLWAVMGRRMINETTIPFVRLDWLSKLGMQPPSSLAEFEAYLYACKDNAELLLGDDASQMTPLFMTEDIGWVAGALLQSFVPNDATDKDLYVTGLAGERYFFRPGAKEAIRKLNQWYNDGLLHTDFPLFSSSNTAGDDALKAGWVGAIAGHSWNQPYRDRENGWTGMMQQEQGPDANWLAVNTFENDAGFYRKFFGTGADRSVYIPATCTEPIAALLYMDWMCNYENLRFLQIGEEGINHRVMPSGAIEMIPSSEVPNFPADNVMVGVRNYDYTPMINDLWLGDTALTDLSQGYAYPPVDPTLVQGALEVLRTDARYLRFVGFPVIQAEDGLGSTVQERAQAAWALAITAPVADFDAVYDAQMGVLYDEFVNASMAERTAAWEERYGSEVMVPEN